MPETILLFDKYLLIKRRHESYYIFCEKKDKKGNDGSSLISRACINVWFIISMKQVGGGQTI